jgi:hypothetical protein
MRPHSRFHRLPPKSEVPPLPRFPVDPNFTLRLLVILEQIICFTQRSGNQKTSNDSNRERRVDDRAIL